MVRIMTYKSFLKSLDKLIDSIEDNIVNDEQRVTNLKAAWTVGRDVYNYKRETGMTTKQIAEDAGVPSGTMDKFVRVYRLFPKGVRAQIEGHPLSWAHYAALIYVRSEEAREFYLREAALKEWSSHDLRRRIRDNYFKTVWTTCRPVRRPSGRS